MVVGNSSSSHSVKKDDDDERGDKITTRDARCIGNRVARSSVQLLYYEVTSLKCKSLVVKMRLKLI